MYFGTQFITEKIRNQEPVVFLKFGDGEYQCVAHPEYRHNCDGDSYTPELRNGLISSFQYIIQQPNVLIGAWHSSDVCRFWTRVAGENAAKIQWTDYHTIIIDKADLENKEALKIKRDFLISIQQSPLPKIIVCNVLLSKMVLLFCGECVKVGLRDWYDVEGFEILNRIEKKLEKKKSIIMFAAGMSSKVLISKLHKLYPNNIYLDIGSGMDILCTKKDSRGRGYNYEDLYNVLNDLLPPNWNDPKYNKIYEEAQTQLGIHLPK